MFSDLVSMVTFFVVGHVYANPELCLTSFLRMREHVRMRRYLLFFSTLYVTFVEYVEIHKTKLNFKQFQGACHRNKSLQ